MATEKVDGTNARIIFLPDGNFILGSREELLFAKGDLIGNPALGIVDALKDKAEAMGLSIVEHEIVTFYCEVYGGKVTAASKQYTGERKVGFRLFDIGRIEHYDAILRQGPEQISSWREHGGQSFVNEETLVASAKEHGFEQTPRIVQISATQLPTGIEETLQFLSTAIATSQCVLDGSAGGEPEGLVIRTADRSQIAKLRFQDYRRTLKRRKSGK
ncbi:MAG: RNA ligase family protein [Chloroflexota bacterium]